MPGGPWGGRKPYRQSTPTPPRPTPAPRRALPGTPASRPIPVTPPIRERTEHPDRDGQRRGPRCATATQLRRLGERSLRPPLSLSVMSSALATYVHRVLTCRGDTPALGPVRQVEWREGAMAEPVRARRPADQEGRRLLQIVRRGKHGSVRVRRAMIIMAPASGTLAPAIARLAAADEDTVRDVIHTFNAKGLAALDPRWAGAAAAAPSRARHLVPADHTLAALKSIRAARPDGYRLFVIMDNLAANKTRRSGAGPGGRTPSCASRPRTHPGPIRSRRSPVRYAPLSWAAQTTGITPRWPASCRPACAGVMPTPATPACWPPSAANAPASAANASNAGAARNLKLHNRAGARSWPAH